MFKPIVGKLVLAFLFIAVVLYAIAQCSHNADASLDMPQKVEQHIAIVSASTSMTLISAAPAASVPDDALDALVNYVFDAMTKWNKGPMAGAATRLRAIASDIAVVARREPRIWKDSNGAREAILLASIGFHESRFRDYVYNFDCNRWAAEAYKKTGSLNLSVLPLEAQKLMTLGTCDGGIALDVTQTHLECGGVYLLDDGSWQSACSPMPRKGIVSFVSKETVLAGDHRSLLRVALAMARQSIRAGAGLRNYVGGAGPERSRMASQRLDFALSWSARHPY